MVHITGNTKYIYRYIYIIKDDDDDIIIMMMHTIYIARIEI